MGMWPVRVIGAGLESSNTTSVDFRFHKYNIYILEIMGIFSVTLSCLQWELSGELGGRRICPGWKLSKVGVLRSGSCPGGSCPSGNCPGGS